MDAPKIEADGCNWRFVVSFQFTCGFLNVFVHYSGLFIYWPFFFSSLKMLLCSITDRLKCIFSKGIITLSGGTLIAVMFIFDNPSGQDTCRTCPDGVLDADAGQAVPSLLDCGEDGRCSPASVEAFQHLTGQLGCLGGCCWGHLRVSSA